MILEKPVHSVVIAGFFVGCQREYQVTIGFVVLPPQTNKGRDPYCGHCFIVRSSPPVEITIFFGEFERIDRPILPRRFHDVEMSEEQQRLSPVVPTIPRNKVSFASIWTEHLNIRLWKAGRLQPFSHGFSGFG